MVGRVGKRKRLCRRSDPLVKVSPERTLQLVDDAVSDHISSLTGTFNLQTEL